MSVRRDIERALVWGLMRQVTKHVPLWAALLVLVVLYAMGAK